MRRAESWCQQQKCPLQSGPQSGALLRSSKYHRMLRTAGPVLAAQTFAGNLLVRGIGSRKLEQILQDSSANDRTLFALVADRRVAVVGGGGGGGGGSGATAGAAAGAAATTGGPTAVQWLNRAGLAALSLTYGGSGEQMAVGSQLAPVYFLGEDLQAQSLRLAVDVTAVPPADLDARHIRLQDLRSLMPLLPADELAIAGHAMALSQWHQAHLFCGRCGAPSVSVDGGARRQCTAHEAHRQYPRTDPVVIMLVESPDGSAALLGRSRKMRPGMLTCLSGFCDQGESIEEAVRRETREEAGIDVVAVDIVGSQPWPVGRGGSCELMIGCIGKAGGADITMDPEEMAEVRWVSKADVAEAVRQSEAPDSPYYGGQAKAAGGLGFFVPPPIAIAHHLLRQWAMREGPWFSADQPQQQAGQGAAAEAAAAAAAAPASHL